MTCACQGSQHLVCRDWRVGTTRDTLAQFRAPISDPPARPRVFDCGCAGRQHPVCDPTFRRLTTERPASKVRPMTLRRALAEGMTLRPHAEHVYHCPADCDRVGIGVPSHSHKCLCGDESPATWFGDESRGVTLRAPVTRAA